MHVKALTTLQWLDLGGTNITDIGLERLKGLTELRLLRLTGTKITDAGLVHLKGLTKSKRCSSKKPRSRMRGW